MSFKLDSQRIEFYRSLADSVRPQFPGACEDYLIQEAARKLKRSLLGLSLSGTVTLDKMCEAIEDLGIPTNSDAHAKEVALMLDGETMLYARHLGRAITFTKLGGFTSEKPNLSFYVDTHFLR